MLRPRDSDGYSLIELLIVLVMATTTAAIVLPSTSALFGNLRLSGDARALSNSVSLVKMRAAANFTQARLYADLAARTYRVELFQRSSNTWASEGGAGTLSYRVNMGTGGLTAAPSNTQSTIGQAPACLDNAGTAVANTACIVFNSRGTPIDNTGAPTAADAIYINDGSAAYGVTVGASGLIRMWKSGLSQAAWIRQ